MSTSVKAAVISRGLAAVLALALFACGASPSKAPLSPPSARNMSHERPSSSRSPDGAEGDTEEIQVTPDDQDDDDGDGDSKTPRSSERLTSASVRVSSSAVGPDPAVSSAACRIPADSAPDCSLLPGARTCLGAKLARKACETVGPVLDPRVGDAWMACMRQPSSANDACDAGRIVACGLKAVSGACIDGSNHELCAGIARDCADMAPEITATVCEELLGAWKPEARPKMVECLRNGCSTGGFGACLP